MSRKSIERKLVSLSEEISAVKADLVVALEQLAHFQDESDDARLRSLVSETPQAQKVARDAAATVTAYERDRNHQKAKLEKLEAKQDQLLDQLSATS